MSKLLFALLASNIWPFRTINALVNAAIGTFWVAAIPLCLIEHRGPIDSLIGSVRLVKKHWLTVFTLVVAVSLIRATVLFFIESHFPGGFGGLLSGFHLIGFPLSAFLLSFKYVMFIVIYYDLSDWRDQRRLAGVFNAA